MSDERYQIIISGCHKQNVCAIRAIDHGYVQFVKLYSIMHDTTFHVYKTKKKHEYKKSISKSSND